MSPQAIEQIAQRVKTAMQGFEPGHDHAHVLRVRKNAVQIQLSEGGNALVMELAALLHEMGDTKFFDPSHNLPMVRGWLIEADVDTKTVEQVMAVVEQIGFSKQLDTAQTPSLELSIVQDADRLEAIGAIGVARAFSYGASKQRPFFDEYTFPNEILNASQYKKSQSPTVNHFFEKLFRLREMMLTPTGKQLAQQRHQTTWLFLKTFLDENAFEDKDNRLRWYQLLEGCK